MKRTILLFLALAVIPPAFAQSGDMKGMDMKGMDMKDMPMKGMDMKKGARDVVHQATGVVTRTEKDKVTIKHGPVPTLKWSAMTMAFTVKDKALMDKLKSGQTVNFEFVQEGRDYVIMGVR